LKTNIDKISISPFRPAPWCLNGHVHTIGRSLLSRSAKPPHRRIEIPTPDDDFLELDLCDNSGSDNDGSGVPVIALFHGLEGSTDRFYITELMNLFYEWGWTSVGVNFRGCGSRLNRRRRFYHSGETEDFATVFEWIGRQFPGRPLGAVGFSLGGNALLKSLGEEEERHPADAAVAVSVPYDLELGSRVISKGFNKVYEYRFLRTLRKKLEAKRRVYPDLPEFTGSTLYEFDDQVTSRIHGFRDAEDYYETCSAKRFVGRIRTPALLIHSLADPICPASAMPLELVREKRALSYILTRDGGHVGFWSRPRGWINRTVGRYLADRLASGASSSPPYHEHS